MTSLPRASAAIVSSTAAALLLTTVAASAPVIWHSSSSTIDVAVAAPAAGQVVFEVVGPAIMASRCCRALLGQKRAAEVGVDHGAGEVEHVAHARGQAMRHTRSQCICQGLRRHLIDGKLTRHSRATQAIQQSARLGGHQRVAMLGHERGYCGLAQQAVDGRQILRVSRGAGLGTVDDGFCGPHHQAAPGSGGGSGGRSGSPNSSIRFRPWRSLPVSDTSRSSVRLARSSATGSTKGSRSVCTIFR